MTLDDDEVARVLASLAPAPPPAAEGVVAAALATRRPGRSVHVSRPASPLEVLRDRIADFAEAVAAIDGDGWARRAAPYPWTVHQLVAHLAAIEAYVAHLVGIPGFPPPLESAHDHLAMTEPSVQAAPLVPPEVTVAQWHATATTVADHVEAGGPDALRTRVGFHGIDLSLRSLLILRGFELWTHADDIRRATGRDVVDPPADVVHTMSALSVGALPLLVPTAAPRTARLVLSGAGGGAWTIGIGGPAGDEPDVEVLADAVDWCRLASRRLDPGDLDATVDGDRSLLADVYAAAQAMAF